MNRFETMCLIPWATVYFVLVVYIMLSEFCIKDCPGRDLYRGRKVVNQFAPWLSLKWRRNGLENGLCHKDVKCHLWLGGNNSQVIQLLTFDIYTIATEIAERFHMLLRRRLSQISLPSLTLTHSLMDEVLIALWQLTFFFQSFELCKCQRKVCQTMRKECSSL